MSDNAPEMRRYERFLFKDTLISVILKPFGHDKDIWGIITNASMHGFQISLPVRIDPETMVAITVTWELEEDLSEIEHFVGRIRWCKPDDLLDETYNMGIEILELKNIHTETDATP
jgi:hypothetical protein